MSFFLQPILAFNGRFMGYCLHQKMTSLFGYQLRLIVPLLNTRGPFSGPTPRTLPSCRSVMRADLGVTPSSPPARASTSISMDSACLNSLPLPEIQGLVVTCCVLRSYSSCVCPCWGGEHHSRATRLRETVMSWCLVGLYFLLWGIRCSQYPQVWHADMR